MIKKNIKLLTGVAVCSVCLSLTGCIEETIPTDGFTQEQVDASNNTISALLMALPAQLNTMDARGSISYGDYAFGYGAMMHIRDVETEDMSVPYTGYDHFSAWATNKAMGEDYMYMQYVWNYYYQSILACNKLLAAVEEVEEPTTFELGAKGEAYAFRAMLYLDLARCYEYLPCDVNPSGVNADGNNVTGLTVPIVTEATTLEETKNNPRATHEEMFSFILEDLNQAEQLIPNLDGTTYATDKTLASLAVVYGLKARLYMWDEEYEDAARYAGMAITASGLKPISLTDCFNIEGGYVTSFTKTCFNDISKWMWGVSQTEESATVTSGIINWTSWMTPEAAFGYAGAGAVPCIYLPLLNRIYPTDWRAMFWNGDDLVYPGVSSKFQPNDGNTSVPSVGAVVSYPLMRVEEMHFIQIEAIARQDINAGIQQLTTFMNTNRCAEMGGGYTCNATTPEDLIEEIIFQKRIELWGEGQTFFDIKRLNYSVDRTQEGSNFSDDRRFKTNGRPAWMNWVIVKTESNSNSALVGKNNPDPTDAYPLIPAE